MSRDIMNSWRATDNDHAHEADSLDDHNPIHADDALVVQADVGPPAAFPVTIEQVVTVRQAPSIAAAARTLFLTDTVTPLQAGSSDPRRSGITLVSSQSFWYGPRRDIAGSGTGALIPANVPLVLANADEVWVRAATGNTATANSPQTIAAVSEQWAR